MHTAAPTTGDKGTLIELCCLVISRVQVMVRLCPVERIGLQNPVGYLRVSNEVSTVPSCAF